MKKHQCGRCKRHVSKVVEIAKKSGVLRSYCESCLETMRNKGANFAAAPDGQARKEQRDRHANEVAVAHGSNRR